jgi:hypothetical protein
MSIIIDTATHKYVISNDMVSNQPIGLLLPPRRGILPEPRINAHDNGRLHGRRHTELLYNRAWSSQISRPSQ